MKELNWTKWSSIAEVVSSVAILITLIYLSAQTRQNNELLKVQAISSLSENQAEYGLLLATNSEFTSFLTDYGYAPTIPGFEKVPPEELGRILGLASYIFANWNQEYIEYQNGRIEIPVGAYISVKDAYPFLPDLWKGMKFFYPEEFRNFLDNNVFNEE